MLEEESKLRNRVWNVRKTPTRLIKSVSKYGARLMNCLSWAADDYDLVIDKRKEKRKELFKGKPRHKKALNAPVFWWVYAVSQAEKVIKPSWRLVGNVVTSTKNLGEDIKKSIWWLVSTKPVENFSYSDLKLAQERPDTENKSFLDPNKPRTSKRWNRQRWRGKLNKSTLPEEKDNPKTTQKKEIIDSDRVSNEIPENIEISNRWQTMVNYINESHPELTIEFDETTTRWHVKWPKSWNKIIVWSKKKENVQQILYHEITHVLIDDNVKWIQELINVIKSINQNQWKQLFLVSTHKHYDTQEKKTIEDTCELLALYSRGDWKFDKYMKKLRYRDDKKLAKLAKIEQPEARHLKELCKNVISWLNTINLNKEKVINTPN